MASNKKTPEYSTGKKVEIAARRMQVLQLCVAGASSRQIAAQVGVKHPTILRDVKAILGELADQARHDADIMRARETERYQRMILSWWPLAIGERNRDGTWKILPAAHAATVVFTAIKGIRDIWGLDAPVSVQGKIEEIHTRRQEAIITVVYEDPKQA